jgi:hypothetical protein
MSQFEQMKMQLHGLADQSRQGAASLAGFKQRFEQSSQQVQALIRGTPGHIIAPSIVRALSRRPAKCTGRQTHRRGASQD